MVGVVAEQEVAQRTMGKKDGDQHGIEGDGIERDVIEGDVIEGDVIEGVERSRL